MSLPGIRCIIHREKKGTSEGFLTTIVVAFLGNFVYILNYGLFWFSLNVRFVMSFLIALWRFIERNEIVLQGMRQMTVLESQLI